MQIVIGLVGPIASGKGTIAEFLKSKGFVYYSLSDVVRDEATRRGLELSRKNLQDVGNDLRERFGGAVLVERLAELISKQEFVVIDGIRNPQEIEAIKTDFGGKIVAITAYKNRRLERYIKRAQTRGEDSASKGAFEKVDARDQGVGEDKNGQQGQECIDLADFYLKNNDTIEQFYKDCDEMLDSFFIQSHSMSFSEVVYYTHASQET